MHHTAKNQQRQATTTAAATTTTNNNSSDLTTVTTTTRAATFMKGVLVRYPIVGPWVIRYFGSQLGVWVGLLAVYWFVSLCFLVDVCL